MGVFGGWGIGKTTFLALLAKELESTGTCKLVYFNSWKYAGFMEIVPALIYKIFQYGMAGAEQQQDRAALSVLLALGKKYSDQVGDWAQGKIGVDPVMLFKDVFDVARQAHDGRAPVAPDVIRAYYTQVDKAQDSLRAALGSVASDNVRVIPIVVLVDELDRCDPDEAFNVIKQMRVLFGMRDLPISFVVCANPEPIGLAIKHRYGLESETSDYEARRILEKFVDNYYDLGEAAPLRAVVEALWQAEPLPWVLWADEANVRPDFDEDVVLNATALDAFNTSVPQLANLRVLRKSFEYVQVNARSNRHFMWTKWLLEICNQVDPVLRQEIRLLALTIQECVRDSHAALPSIECRAASADGRTQIKFGTDKGKTLFAILRSLFWERAKAELQNLQEQKDPEAAARAQSLSRLLAAPLTMEFVVLLGMLPFKTERVLPDRASFRLNFGRELNDLVVQLGYELAS
jgi:hypothetical protein